MTQSPPRHRTRPAQATAEAQAPRSQAVGQDGGERAAWIGGRAEDPLPGQAVSATTDLTIATFDEASEEDIFRDILRDYSPQGVVETTWCRDLARNIHHATRLRLIRDKYLEANRKAGITEQAIRDAILSNLALVSADDYFQRAHELLLNGSEVAEKRGVLSEYRRVAQRAKDGGFDVEQVEARAYFAEIYKFESIEKMIVLTDTRRDNITRDLEKRQSAREGRRQLLSNSPSSA